VFTGIVGQARKGAEQPTVAELSLLDVRWVDVIYPHMRRPHPERVHTAYVRY